MSRRAVVRYTGGGSPVARGPGKTGRGDHVASHAKQHSTGDATWPPRPHGIRSSGGMFYALVGVNVLWLFLFCAAVAYEASKPFFGSPLAAGVGAMILWVWFNLAVIGIWALVNYIRNKREENR